MDPNLEITAGLREEIGEILLASDRLAKGSSHETLSQLKLRIQRLFKNAEFQEKFEKHQPTLKRLVQSLNVFEQQGKSDVGAGSLNKVNSEIKSLFRRLVDKRKGLEDLNFSNLSDSYLSTDIESRLHTCTFYGQRAEVQEILNTYKIPFLKLIQAIGTACGNCSPEDLTFLLETISQVDDLPISSYVYCELFKRIRDKKGQHEAALQIFKILADHGFDPNRKDAVREYPLQIEAIGKVDLAFVPISPRDLQEYINWGVSITPEPDMVESLCVTQFLDSNKPELVGVLVYNGAQISEETTSRMRKDPRFAEMLDIREEALAALKEEILPQILLKLQESPGVKESPRVLQELMGVYALPSLAVITNTPVYRERLLTLCHEIEIKRRVEWVKKLASEIALAVFSRNVQRPI